MPVTTQKILPQGQYLTEDQVREVLHQGLSDTLKNQKVLVLIPDHTRSIPLPMLFRVVCELLHDTKQLDFLVALGTHPPLSEDDLNHLVGISAEERQTAYREMRLLNHAWQDPETLIQIGTIMQDEVKKITGDQWHPSLGDDVPVRINRLTLEYDHILILGPTFPHEVVGFSGGSKYLFPGISGEDMINVTHWLGALIGILDIIGIADTPVRNMIHRAAEMLTTPITLASMVILNDKINGLFVGDVVSAWQAAADLSSQRHIVWVDKPFQRVLSWADAKYDELWTAAKAMYKLEPAIADGGEVIVYSPQLEDVSLVHSDWIYKAGYHIRDYYLHHWDHFKDYPLGVLAHGTHLRGAGIMDGAIEKPRIKVTLATGIPEIDCAQLALGYLDPSTIDVQQWQHREAEGIKYVPHAGEMLYRVKPSKELT